MSENERRGERSRERTSSPIRPLIRLESLLQGRHVRVGRYVQ